MLLFPAAHGPLFPGTAFIHQEGGLQVSPLQVSGGGAQGPHAPHPQGRSRVRAPPAQCGGPRSVATTHHMHALCQTSHPGDEGLPGGQNRAEGHIF